MATSSLRIPLEVLGTKAGFVGGLAHLIMGWSNAESWFQTILWTLLGSDEDAAHVVFYSHKNSVARLELVAGLAQQRDINPTLIKELAVLIRRFKELSRRRNFYAHALYKFGEHDSIEYATGVRFNVQDQAYRSETIPIDNKAIKELRDNFRGFQKLIVDLEDFANRLGADPKVRRLKPPPRQASKRSAKASRHLRRYSTSDPET